MSAILRGGHGDDTLDGTTGNDTFNLTLGGEDTANGGDGNDVFWLGASFDAGDKIDGGDGRDRATLNGDYTGAHALVFAADTMLNVEHLYLAAGHSYDLTTDDATVAAGARLTINAGNLGSGDSLTFDGSAESDGQFNITGGAGADDLTGGAGKDVFHMEKGGSDIVHGGDGNDVVYMGSQLGTFGAPVTIDGGAGFDTVVLDGMGDDAIIFGATTTMTNVEDLVLGAGHSYNLTINDATVAAVESLIIDGSALGAGDTLTFDGHLENDGTLLIAGGAGNDTITGGNYGNAVDFSLGGNDSYTGGTGFLDEIYMGAALTAADKIAGGGAATFVVLDGDYTGANAVTFNATTMTGVTEIDLVRNHSYDLTTDDATVGAGEIMTVDGTFLSFLDSMKFDGSAETDGAFNLYDGKGNDVLIGGAGEDSLGFDLGGSDIGKGGAGNDFFDACGQFSSGDQFDGGSDYDIIELTAADARSGRYTDNHALHLTDAMMANFEEMDLDGGGNYDITTSDGNVASGLQFLVDATYLFSTDRLTFNGAAETDGSFDFSMDEGIYSLTGGAGDDIFHVHGGFTNLDKIDGGGHVTSDGNIVAFDGDYSLAFSTTAFQNVQTLRFDSGHDYDVTLNDANIASGESMTLDGAGLGAGDTLTIDASSETDGNINFYDGAGDDVLTGGTGQINYFNLGAGGNDTIHTEFSIGGQNYIYMFDSLTAADIIDGAAGYDQVDLNGDYTGANAVAFGATTMTGIDKLYLVGSHSYDLTTDDATVDSALNPSLTVDSTNLGATDPLKFDGSAETDSNFVFNVGAETDTLTGGAQGDTFNMGANLTAADAVDGGAGYDVMTLNGDYFTGNAATFGATTLTNIEEIDLTAGNAYNLTTNNATVAAGETLKIDASSLGFSDALVFDGSAETNGHFTIVSGDGEDTITGGSLADTFTGGGGEDTFLYTGAAQSSSTWHDTITDYNADDDVFQLGVSVTGVFAVSGSVSDASFDSDLSGLGVIQAQGATIVTVTGGGLNGHTLLVIDGNGDDIYTAGQDYVIDITGYTGTITTDNFI